MFKHIALYTLNMCSLLCANFTSIKLYLKLARVKERERRTRVEGGIEMEETTIAAIATAFYIICNRKLLRIVLPTLEFLQPQDI